MEEYTLRLASFDIGGNNFAQYIEDFSAQKIKEIQIQYHNLPASKQRRIKGELSPDIESILTQVYLCGKRVQTGVYNFSSEESENFGLDIHMRLNILEHLQKYKDLWDTCDIFVIEQQFFNLQPGRKKKGVSTGANVDAIKIGEAVFMWFLERYSTTKPIVYFGSQFKTQIFGAPWKLSKPERKKWSTQKVLEIYNQRDDKDMMNIFALAENVKCKRVNTEAKITLLKGQYNFDTLDAKEMADCVTRHKQKLDDISDAMLQAQAYKFKFMVACF